MSAGLGAASVPILWRSRGDCGSERQRSRPGSRPRSVAVDNGRHVVEQAVRDLAVSWSTAPITLELTGPGGGSWLIGSDEPVIRRTRVVF